MTVSFPLYLKASQQEIVVFISLILYLGWNLAWVNVYTQNVMLIHQLQRQQQQQMITGGNDLLTHF